MVLFMAGVYWFTFFDAKQKELAAANEKLGQLQNELAESRTLAADLPRFKAELDRLNAELTEALRQLPNDKELPGLLTDITTLGKNAGLEFKAFIPQEEVDKGFYAEVPINIELIGGFHELATFFDELTRLDRIVNVTNFRVDEVNVQPNQIELRIGGVATTFRFISPEEAAARDAAKNAEAEGA
jgi:type IV pilus assembly protein PilO